MLGALAAPLFVLSASKLLSLFVNFLVVLHGVADASLSAKVVGAECQSAKYKTHS